MLWQAFNLRHTVRAEALIAGKMPALPANISVSFLPHSPGPAL
jgi:hypothetical protein